MGTKLKFLLFLFFLNRMTSYVGAEYEAAAFEDFYMEELEDVKFKQEILKIQLEELKEHIKLSDAALSCHDLRSRPSNLGSLFYPIDPDGVGVGEPPVTVFCDIETGETEIAHQYSDEEVDININECDTAGCKKYSIQYESAMSQIIALTEMSESCTQEIQFSCLLTSLESDGEQQGWWVDRHGNKQIFWTGYHPGQHVCSCALSEEKKCLQPERKCNCDTKEPVWHSDRGILTNKSILPVTAIHYGSNDSAFIDLHGAKFKLGPLKCSGRTHVDPNSSCKNMKRTGNTASGYYLLKPEDSRFPEMMYCDMQKAPDEYGFEKNFGLPADLRETVIFDVYLTSGRKGDGIILNYDGININLSEGIDYRTGIFTAPISGFYFFSFNAIAEKDDFNHVTLEKDGKTITGAYDDNLFGNSRYSTLSFSISLGVDKGETIYVKNMHGKLWDSENKYAHFSGHLLQPKPKRP